MILRNTRLITFLIVVLSFTAVTSAEDYLEDLVDPRDRMERGPEVSAGYDFDNVIFNREYFYSLTEGIIQFRNSNNGPWKTLDLNIGVMRPDDEELTEVPAEDSWENEVAPATVEARTTAGSSAKVRQQITKPENIENKNEKTREKVLRELQRSIDSGR